MTHRFDREAEKNAFVEAIRLYGRNSVRITYQDKWNVRTSEDHAEPLIDPGWAKAKRKSTQTPQRKTP